MLSRLPNEEASADSGKMQYCRRNQETGSIGDTADVLRNFGSVSVTVKNSEQADDAHRRRDGGFDIKRDDCTERDNRKGHTDLDKGNPDASDTERTGCRYDGEEGRRNEPKRATAKLPRKNADHHHGEDVIEAGNWMPKPMDKAARIADPRVGKGNRRRKDRQCCREA